MLLYNIRYKLFTWAYILNFYLKIEFFICDNICVHIWYVLYMYNKRNKKSHVIWGRGLWEGPSRDLSIFFILQVEYISYMYSYVILYGESDSKIKFGKLCSWKKFLPWELPKNRKVRYKLFTRADMLDFYWKIGFVICDNIYVHILYVLYMYMYAKKI